MGKLSVIIYITIAFLILLLISHSPNKSPHRNPHRRHRRLKLRSNLSSFTTNHHISFDPLIADIEWKRQDRLWERSHLLNDHDYDDESNGRAEWEGFVDPEDNNNNNDDDDEHDHRLNITHRLVLLFPRIDVDPADGFVSEGELTEWNRQQSHREVVHRSQREMELHDKNHDGLVSFAEYQPPSWVLDDSDSNSFGHDMGWWKEEHFNASDSDGDGFLNITEFNDFQHPADTKNPRLLQWLCKEEVRERDTDKDGQLNFKEFFHGLFDMVRNYDEDAHNSSSHESTDSLESPARSFFAQLDKDGDGFLSDVELLPIIGKLHPSERYYAKQQAEYIISQADTDKDGRLSLTEMVDNPYVFYSAIFNEDEDEDYEYHEEFR